MSYTKQTPAAVKDSLQSKTLAFPEGWSLTAVAEESRRRYLSHQWHELDAMRFVVHWATHKLAGSREFTEDCWAWIAGAGDHAPHDHHRRLLTILAPAIAQGPGWRKTDADKSELLQQIGDKACDLLRILETERRLDVDLRDVAGLRPDIQPLVDREFEIQQQRTQQIQQWHASRREGEDPPFPPPLHPGFIGGPHLSDYLGAFIAKILGEGKRAPVDFRAFFPGDALAEPSDETSDEAADDEWEIDDERLAEILDGKPALQGPHDPSLLRDGGEFGAYPNRATALRSAVIRAFPEALFDRTSDPPKTTPASVIESACIIWFGASPERKEINGMIKEDRERLEGAMHRMINSAKKHDARREKWEQEGLSAGEMWKREMQAFLDED